MKRKIISIEFRQSYRARPGEGRRDIELECGHTETRKASVPIPKKPSLRCSECESLRNGARCVRKNVLERWDRTTDTLQRTTYADQEEAVAAFDAVLGANSAPQRERDNKKENNEIIQRNQSGRNGLP